VLLSSRLRKNSASRRFWEGHEFHSCRNCLEINSGFQPLGKAALEEHIFRSLLRQVIKEIVLRHFADGGQRGLVIGLGLGEIGCGHRQIGAAKSGLLLAQL